MATSPAPVPSLPGDDALPGAGVLLDEGPRALGAFLATRGWSLTEARPTQALYRPGRSCTLRYQARGRNRDGEARLLTLCVETRARDQQPPAPPDAFEARYGLADPVEYRSPYLVWAFPYDPSLPGLYEAAQGPVVRDALDRGRGRRPSAVTVEPLRYRPRRRAVLRYLALGPGGTEVVYSKVLRPDKGDAVAGTTTALRHRRRARLRVTRPRGRVDGGALLFSELPGRSLRDLLLAGASLPAPARVARVLDDLPRLHRGPLRLEPVTSRNDPFRAAAHGRDLITRLVPGAADDAARVADAVIAAAERDNLPRRVVHGDLYEAQLFVDERFGLGVIDLDDLGPGDPALDAANFCAHLVALGLSVPSAWHRLLAYRTLVRAEFRELLGISPDALAWREALAMLLLATGPFRVLDPNWPAEVKRRVELAVRFLP